MKRTANDPIQKVEVVNGIPIYIEWPKGSIRTYKRSGKQVLMHADYGYVPKTEGADGEELDVYVGEDLESPLVFQLHQKDPDDATFDENKYMVGFSSGEEAKETYLKHVPEDRFGGMEEMTWDSFKKLLSGNKAQQKKAYDSSSPYFSNTPPDSWYTGPSGGEVPDSKYDIGNKVHANDYSNNGSYAGEETDGVIVDKEFYDDRWSYQIDMLAKNEETSVLEQTGDLVWVTEDDIARVLEGSVKIAQYEAKDFRPGEYVTILTIDEIGRVMEVDDEYQHVKVMDEHGQTDIYAPDQLLKTGRRRRQAMGHNLRTAGEDWAANDAKGQPLEEGDQVKNADPGPNDDPEMVYTIIGYSYPQIKVKDTNGEVGYAMPSASIKIASIKQAVAGISAREEGGNLVITVDEETQQEVKELVESGDTSDQAMWNLFDTPGFLGSGYEPTSPESIGALTSAPIIEHDGKYYWYPQYESRSPLEDLAESGKTVFQGAQVEKGAMKKVAMLPSTEKIMDIDNELLERSGAQSGQFILQDPWASEFVRRVRDTVGPVDDDVIMELEDENYHSAIRLLVMNDLVTGTYYTKETYAKKKTAGYSTRNGDKSEIQSLYSSLTLASTNDEGFRKPSFNKINDQVSIGDNGTVTVFSGEYMGHPFGPDDYINAQDAGKWYELEGLPEDFGRTAGRHRRTAVEKTATGNWQETNQVLLDESPKICQLNGCTEDQHNCDSYAYLDAEGRILDICGTEYFQGSSEPYAAIPMPWSGNAAELQAEVEEQTFEEESSMTDIGPEPDPMAGPSGMFTGARLRKRTTARERGDVYGSWIDKYTDEEIQNLPCEVNGGEVYKNFAELQAAHPEITSINGGGGYMGGMHGMVDGKDAIRFEDSATYQALSAARREAGQLASGDHVKIVGDSGEGTIGHSMIGRSGVVTDTEGKTFPDNPFEEFNPAEFVMVEIDGTELQFPVTSLEKVASCPPGMSKEVKDKVKKEYGPDDPKTYQTLWKIKDEQKKGSMKPQENDNEIKIGHEVYIKDLQINARVKMIEGGLMTLSNQQFGDHYYVVGDDNVVRRRRRQATDEQEINDLERMKLRLEEQTKETEDENQMRALEERLHELDMEIGRANAKQAMENPNFWNKVGEEDIDGGTDKKLRSPATEEISERGHDEQRAHPSKGAPGEGTEFRHELARRRKVAEPSTYGPGMEDGKYLHIWDNPTPDLNEDSERVEKFNARVQELMESGMSEDEAQHKAMEELPAVTAEEAAPTMGGMPDHVEQKVDSGEAGPAKFALDKDMFKSEDQVRMEANEDAVAGPKKGTDFDEGGFESSSPFIGPAAMPGQEM